VTQHCDTWHQLEAADERAWLDAWARAMKTPEQPWARPDWDCAADLASHIAAVAAHNPVIGRPVLTGAHGHIRHP
jgi:hypothetical protein